MSSSACSGWAEAAGSRTDRLTALRLHDGAAGCRTAVAAAAWQQRSTLCAALSAALPQRDMLSLLPVNHEDVAERLPCLRAPLDAMKWQQGAHQYVLNQDQQQPLGISWPAC